MHGLVSISDAVQSLYLQTLQVLCIPGIRLLFNRVVHKVPHQSSVLQALQLVLGRAITPGSQLQSAFTNALASHNITATAKVLSDISEEGDSIQDQIYSLTAAPAANKHLGAIIGSSVGSGAALFLLATAFVVFGRGWLKNRRLKKQTAACRKVVNCSTKFQQHSVVQLFKLFSCYLFSVFTRLWNMLQLTTAFCVHCQCSTFLVRLP